MSIDVATRQVVRERVIAELPPERRGSRGDVRRVALDALPLLPPPKLVEVVDAVVADVRGLGPLQPLLLDDAADEVLVNPDGRVWVERAGELQPTELLLDPAVVAHLIERIVAPLGLRVDRASPLVDARLPDGSRVNAVLPPLAPDGPCLTIRRFRRRVLPLDAFAPPDVCDLLHTLVRSRANVVVVGGTSSGKTSLLNALATALAPSERVVTVEDTAELRLPLEHVVRLEARPPNAEGAGAVTVRDLVRNALRMRPDRLVVGEARGPEAFDLLQAMNTGHDGSLTTCHANGPADALRRLEALVLLAGTGLPAAAVRDQLCAAIDVVVQVARGPGGRRRVVEVAEPEEAPGADGRPVLHRLAGPERVVDVVRRPPREAAA